MESLCGDGQGRGLFSDANVKKGEFLMVEKAFASSSDNDMDEMQQVQLAAVLGTTKSKSIITAHNLMKKMRFKKHNQIQV